MAMGICQDPILTNLQDQPAHRHRRRKDLHRAALECHRLIHLMHPFNKAIENHGDFIPGIFYALYYWKLRSYKRAALSMTSTDPALCTRAPVMGVRYPVTDIMTATPFMAMGITMFFLIMENTASASLFK